MRPPSGHGHPLLLHVSVEADGRIAAQPPHVDCEITTCRGSLPKLSQQWCLSFIRPCTALLLLLLQLAAFVPWRQSW